MTGEIIFAVAAMIAVALLGAVAVRWCARPAGKEESDRET